jgi:hypothetical protein
MEYCHTGIQSFKNFWAESYLENGLEESNPFHSLQDFITSAWVSSSRVRMWPSALHKDPFCTKFEAVHSICCGRNFTTNVRQCFVGIQTFEGHSVGNKGGSGWSVWWKNYQFLISSNNTLVALFIFLTKIVTFSQENKLRTKTQN